MYRVGQKEVDAIGKLLLSGKLFRYGYGGECDRFEKRYAKFLGVKHVLMTSSGTTALTAALAGLNIGPGDEVIVPCHTYMATALAVLAVGAIPIIVDIDESLTLCPDALQKAIGPHTRAVIPVHLWGLSCNMRALMRIAKKHKLVVVEDTCQAVGGGYRGRMLGSIGHFGAFSFNFYKNMTCGEGGALVTNDSKAFERARAMIDPCNMYWTGRSKDFMPFCANGSRASEIAAAMLNVQLDRLPAMIRTMRRQHKRVMDRTQGIGLIAAKYHCQEDHCAANNAYLLPTAEQAESFCSAVGGFIAGKTGRHVYTEWDPILTHRGAHHPALDPFRLPQNSRCRKRYSKDMCAASLEILNRAVLVPNHPDRKATEVSQVIRNIRAAAKQVN
jgi:dTDP-4-amino-4,6-dideoxygalactose transaminase